VENNSGVIWVRVSSEPQSHGYSPDAQLNSTRDAARLRGINIVREFMVAESAKESAKRKEFRAMIEFIKGSS